MASIITQQVAGNQSNMENFKKIRRSSFPYLYGSGLEGAAVLLPGFAIIW